jgi:peptide/nickel transport system substrate-binding protein
MKFYGLACILLFQIVLGPAGIAYANSELRTRLNSDILSTQPGVKRDENTDAVILHIVEGLVAFREDTTIAPLLADKIDISPDGTNYRFHLRSGIQFHNGAALTAADVEWSLKRYMDPATQWRCLPDFDGHSVTKILSIKATDPSIIDIQLEQPSALFLTLMARQECGGTAILHRDSINPDGSWRMPVGTGPYKLAAWKPGNYVELEKFNGYAPLPGPADGNTGGKHALADKIRFLIIPDDSATTAALLSGAIDVYDGIPATEARNLINQPGLQFDRHPTMDFFALLFQTNDPLLKDQRIRKAIALALDTRLIVSAATQDKGIWNNSAIPTTSPFHSPATAQGYEYNLGASKALLREAGYSGQKITLVTNKRYPALFDMAVLVQAMALEAGINFTLDVVDWASELDRYTKGKYQAMAFAYSSRLDPSLCFDAFMGPKAQQPRKVWDNPEAQNILRQSMVTSDIAQRQALLDNLHGQMIQQVPLVVMFNPLRLAATRNGIHGFKTWPSAQMRLWDVSVSR